MTITGKKLMEKTPLKAVINKVRKITEDGYVTNGFIAVKKEFDKKIDKEFVDAEKSDLSITNLASCSRWKMIKVEEKVNITKLTVEYSDVYDVLRRDVYMDSDYYRYMTKKKLEITANPDRNLIMAIKDDMIVMIAIAIRDGEAISRKFEEDDTVEEYLKAKNREEQEKQENKRKIRQYIEEQATDIFNSHINSWKEAELVGKEIKIEKNEFGNYALYLKVDTGNGQGEVFHLFQHAVVLLPHISGTKTEQKIGLSKIVELYNNFK